MLRNLTGNILLGIKKVNLPSRPRAFSVLFQHRKSKKQEHPTKSTHYRGILNNLKTDVSLLQTCRLFSQYQPQKKFTVNGAITSLTSPGYYFVDPAEENQRVLLPGIYAGAYIMLYGPRGCGKSTQMYRAIEQLQDDFICLTVTFQNGVNFDDKHIFWSSFGRMLCESNKHITLPKITSSTDFALTFSSSNKDKIFQGKNVVLFIDEFDRLYQGPQEVIDSMLDTLRGLKQQAASYCLQSFIGVGPFSILALTGKSSSPFNVRDAVQVRYWTREEVHQLFSQYSDTIDTKIVDDIYERTRGHPGLVCLCGKVISEKVVESINSYDSWLRFATYRLVKEVIVWPTMQKLIDSLSDDTLYPHARAARKLLRERFLPNIISPVSLDTEEDLKYASYLAAEGALLPVEPSVFKIPSPLVHRLLLERVVSVDKHTIPSLPVPFLYTSRGRTIETVKMLSHAIECFNPAVIQSAYTTSCKKSRMPGSRDQLVPQEAVYHTEMYGVLRSWLPNGIVISNQVNVASAGAQRCDMTIDISPNYKVILEFVANEPLKSIEEHISRVKTYSNLLNAQEAWVIHFTVKEQSEEFTYPWVSSLDTSGNIPINIMHVWHSYPFDQVKVFLAKNKIIDLSLLKRN